MDYATRVINTGRIVKTNDRGWFIFEPSNHMNDTGLILYPGARVKAEAYAPLAYDIAKSG